MKIAVLANDVLRKEFAARPIPDSVELVMVDSLAELLLQEDADAYFDCAFAPGSERVGLLRELLPKPVFINSVVSTLDEIDSPFIRINAWPTFLKRDICELAARVDQRMMATRILDQLQWSYQFTPDVPGMVSARIIAMIINEAYYTFEEGVSSRQEIDIAMKLGTNYPFGPFEWAEKIGLDNIYGLLVRLRETNNRYAISPCLEKEINR
jgi:3-hydroxybutyryl-CoA dehydrogenase